MPIQSREVVTLNLIFDCWVEGEEGSEDEQGLVKDAQVASRLLLLPTEVRLRILRYHLLVDRNRHAHTRRPAANTVPELLFDSPNILEASVFKHKGEQEINGSLPIINRCTPQTAVLQTCKQIYLEGTSILYNENKFVGLQSRIKGLGAKFRNYGIPVWGPLPASRLINCPSDPKNSGFQEAKFNPLILFSAQSSKSDTPFYVCSYKDAADFMHALWIMVECPFSRGMRYNLTLSYEPNSRLINRVDNFMKYNALPLLHAHIRSVDFHRPANTAAEHGQDIMSKHLEKRLQSIRDEYAMHKARSAAEPNLYAYNAICTYLENVMQQADLFVERVDFMSAELFYERVYYEASGIIRTRTSPLVDVSARGREGINRVCKLVAVSAYRLCELRSGTLGHNMARRLRIFLMQLTEDTIGTNDSTFGSGSQPTSTAGPSRSSAPLPPHPDDGPIWSIWSEQAWIRASLRPRWHDERMKHTAATFGQFTDDGEADVEASGSAYTRRLTTRLHPTLAREMAIEHGLLALRLPCASPVHEWNVRLETMLLRAFAQRDDDLGNVFLSVCRMQTHVNLVWLEAKANANTGPQWDALQELLARLTNQVVPGGKMKCPYNTADQVQDVVASLWGERLRPKKSYNSLVWTFRWAG
ncbi:hypothetical protein A1O1_09236 [Capronia coronata CBS 617.96]|uniref:DUF7730 domain-containing protein n=1 Tax=Capronia coronata CBS 617.96 TaxID=1182541 RepID=W9Y900_9EURO|nr:uncharacterized protein A1O1_09236 [Capronia coronata CBS 617.96]EXJ78834.1 hypothetical protein A1O1_09236 [Capronia coronata CBS 617.96]